MKLKTLFIAALLCGTSLWANNFYEGLVTEVRQAGSYTYLEIQEKTKQKFWIAVSAVGGVKVGDQVRFKEEMVAKNFESKVLDKVFETVMFASDLQYRTQVPSPLITTLVEKSPYQKGKSLSIAQLEADRAKYAGKEVIVRAKVVKVSPNIMGKTWVHLQDGTGNEGEVGRIVFTTVEKAPVLGEVVEAKGRVSVDKAFGSDYVYKVIVEETQFSR